MKILISVILFLFGQGVTPDAGFWHWQDTSGDTWKAEKSQGPQYLLIYTALVPDSLQNHVILTGNQATGNRVFATSTPAELTYQYQVPSPRLEERKETFKTLEDVKEFVKAHTNHYKSGGIMWSSWDFTITDISGIYNLTPVEFSKVKVGTHTEFVQETKEIDAPSYEWRIK